jgi:vancomycin resistance protein VanJ
MNSKTKSLVCLGLNAASWIYLILLFGWLGMYFFTGDRFTIIALINYLAVYLFFPLLLVVFAALACRKLRLGFGFLLGMLAFLWLWGAQFTPRILGTLSDEPTLTVMTYNVLAWHEFTEPILKTIRAENPDILLLQELNWNLARTLETDLGNLYPYQILEPMNAPNGIGVISKYPIQDSGKNLPSHWMGGPQVLDLDWNGQTITLVNFHMFPTSSIMPFDQVERSLRLREQEARLLDDLARRSDSVIMAGDANSSPLSSAYQIITSELHDAFREAGFGLGHTFPGSKIPESDRPHIGDWYVPPWLVRIDYVFHSNDWVTISARTARIDEVSDHRGVIVELTRAD